MRSESIFLLVILMEFLLICALTNDRAPIIVVLVLTKPLEGTLLMRTTRLASMQELTLVELMEK